MNGWVAISHGALAIALTVLWYWTINVLTPKINDQDELLSKHNWAYLAQRVGLVLGPVIGSLPMIYKGLDNWTSLGWIAFAFSWAALWGSLGHWIVDWFFLWKRVTKFNDLCVPIGLAKAGFSVGMGVVTFGAFIGDAPSIALGLQSLLVFTALSATALILVLMLFSVLIFGFRVVEEAVEEGLRGRNVRQSLRKSICQQNPAAGLYALGVQLPTSILLAASMAGDFTTWGDSLDGFVTAFGLAAFGAVVSALFIDVTILTGKGITLWGVLHRQEMVAATLLVVFMTVCAAVVAPIVNQWVA